MGCPDSAKCAQCLVEPSETEGWFANIGDRQAGPYLSREIALRVAVADAHALRRSGQTVRVLVKDNAGETRAERCFCARVGR